MGTGKYTEDEIREKFLRLVHSYIHYWHKIPDASCLEKLEGLAFSILVILDGGTSLPGFIVAPAPHPDDKKYCQKNGMRWYPQNHKSEIKCDIAGSLHEMFHEYKSGPTPVAGEGAISEHGEGASTTRPSPEPSR